MSGEVIQQIERGSQAAGKTYQFDEAHDRTRPAEMWFQESEEGEILFLVFYSQACRWSRCLGCNLPSIMSKECIFRSVPKTSMGLSGRWPVRPVDLWTVRRILLLRSSVR